MTSMRPGMPFAHSKIAQYLTKQINALQAEKSQRQIAAEMGYEKPNIISMFKRGEAKVPLDKIPALAKAINVDVAFLFRLGLEQYWPDLHEAMAGVGITPLTRNETRIINVIRKLSGNTDPALDKKDEEPLAKIFQPAKCADPPEASGPRP